MTFHLLAIRWSIEYNEREMFDWKSRCELSDMRILSVPIDFEMR